MQYLVVFPKSSSSIEAMTADVAHENSRFPHQDA
jgi:hypothetical protein